MQNANQILQAIQKLGEKRLPLTRVYRSLYSEDLFLTAYAKIYRNQGALTPGTDPNDTADAMSLDRIHRIVEALRYERYQFRPARRGYVPKKSGGQRPLDKPNWTDKLVQEVLRQVLEAYYEPRFRNSSHGFRPERGCHTALTYVKQQFGGKVWFIEGDIRGCFNNIDHEILMGILSRDIQDGRLLNLIRQSLKAGVMEDWKYQPNHSGTPQGGILSPLLANIYLHELDTFIEDTLIPQYTRGKRRQPNLEYYRVGYAIKCARERGDEVEVQRLEQQRRQLPSQDTHDPHFRRLKYVRYADDFVLGFIGTKAEAETIKTTIDAFLREKLHLEMSEEKTLITHARTEYARFLGYSLSVYHADDKISPRQGTKTKTRSINGVIRLGIPYGLIDEKAKRYMRNGEVREEPALLFYSDAQIIDIYQQRFRGIAEYYKYAADRRKLGKLKHIMETALSRTLAHKFKITVPQVYRKYHGRLEVEGRTYKTLQVEIPTQNGSRMVHWGAIPLRVVKVGTKPIFDNPTVDRTSNRTDLIQRLQANTCELCAVKEPCEVHHVRKLADLKQRWRGRKEKPEWVKRMIAMQRKTLVVCKRCHDDIHAGRPSPKNRI